MNRRVRSPSINNDKDSFAEGYYHNDDYDCGDDDDAVSLYNRPSPSPHHSHRPFDYPV